MRIVFERELSEKNKKYFERIQDRSSRFVNLVAAILMLIPVTLLVVKCGLYFISLYSLNIIFVVGAFVPIKKAISGRNLSGNDYYRRRRFEEFG